MHSISRSVFVPLFVALATVPATSAFDFSECVDSIGSYELPFCGMEGPSERVPVDIPGGRLVVLVPSLGVPSATPPLCDPLHIVCVGSYPLPTGPVQTDPITLTVVFSGLKGYVVPLGAESIGPTRLPGPIPVTLCEQTCHLPGLSQASLHGTVRITVQKGTQTLVDQEVPVDVEFPPSL